MGLLGFGRHRDRSRFGEYHVSRIVHAGEKSQVFAAQPPGPGESPRVAVKLYSKSYDRLAAAIEKKYGIPSEAEVGMTLNPPEGAASRDYPIVRTIGHGREYDKRSGARYVVQEFVDGSGLKHLITCRDPIIETHLGGVVLQLCRALRICHQHGLIFRDFCSDNVLVNKAGNVKLVDLGFVAPVGLAFEERSGTPSYMSPEQVAGEPLGFQTDIYSLGVVVYELLAGRLPYGSAAPGQDARSTTLRRAETMRMHLDEAVPELPEPARRRTPVLAAAMTRCLQKAPEDRFQTIDDLFAALVGGSAAGEA